MIREVVLLKELRGKILEDAVDETPSATFPLRTE